jgi:GT2 family glycosyltransferase
VSDAMDQPRTSVIICTYRREESLCQVIEDVLNQARADDELIVVDQTPEQPSEIEAFLERHAGRLTRLRLERANLPNARNEGVAASSGAIVVCIDDDVRIGPDFLGRLVSHFHDDEVAAVAPMVVDSRGPEAAWADYTRRYGKALARRTGRMMPAREVIGACFAVRRSVFDAVGGFDPRLGDFPFTGHGEETEFFRRFRATGSRAFIDSTLTVEHDSKVAGGCGFRTDGLAEAPTKHLCALVYIMRKGDAQANRSWQWTWLRLLGSLVLRPHLLLAGPGAVYRQMRRLRESVEFVQKFLETESSSAEIRRCPPGPSPT